MKMPNDFYTLTFINALLHSYTGTQLMKLAIIVQHQRIQILPCTPTILVAAVVAVVAIVEAVQEGTTQAIQAVTRKSAAIATSLAIRKKTVSSNSRPKRRHMMRKGRNNKQTKLLNQATRQQQLH
jgi:hypothetical protein